MCVASMIYEHYYDKWVLPHAPYVSRVLPLPYAPPVLPVISSAEIEEFRKLLERAREYDKKNHEPDCEDAEKRRKVKELADLLGVKIDFV